MQDLAKTKINIKSPAKINLHLEVIGKREDGFHELAMIMQNIDLADYFEFEINNEGLIKLESDCIDLSAAFAYYTLQSFIPILLISLSIASWFLGKQEGLDQEIISVAAQILPPSVVELVETTLFKLIDQGFGAGILGAMFLLFTAGNAYLSLQ